MTEATRATVIVAGARLALDAPVCRYLSDPSSGQKHVRGDAGAWDTDAAGAARWSDGQLAVTASTSGGADADVLTIAMRAQVPVTVQSCTIALGWDAARAPFFVDRRLRWGELTAATVITELTPLVLRSSPPGQQTLELRWSGAGAVCRLDWNAGKVALRITLDAAALHPRIQFAGGARSTAAAAWSPTDSAVLRLTARRDGRPVGAPPAVASRFPSGAEAAFVITDHPDFDAVPQFAAVLRGGPQWKGWLDRGLKMTKGVFQSPSLPPTPPASTLEDADYLRLIESLADEGSEIAPHALTEWGQLPGDQVRRDLARFAQRWRPRTWIDHGMTLAYVYSMGAADNPEYRLLDRLREVGIATLWAYLDVPSDPVATLNLIEPRQDDAGAMAAVIVRHLAAGHWPVALHYLRCILDTRVRGHGGHFLRVFMSVVRILGMKVHKEGRIGLDDLRGISGMLAVPLRNALGGAEVAADHYTRSEWIEAAPILYPERPAPLGQVRADDLMVFTTNQLVHIRDAYTPDNLAALVDERGVHIGHTYLLSHKPYLAGLFENDRRDVPSRAWLDFVDALATVVAERRMWNPVMSDLSEWIRGTQAVQVSPDGDGAIELRNLGSGPLRGYTLLLPVAVSPDSVRWGDGAASGHRRWSDWLAVWGDLPPGRPLTVRWDAKAR